MRTFLSYRECLGLDAPSRSYFETHYVNTIDGASGITAAQLSNIPIAFVSSSGGVVGTNDYAVVANATYPGPASPNNTVQVNSGRAYVPNATGTMMYSTYHDTYTSGASNVTIAPNSSGNPRIDAVVLYLDLSASPNAQATNVAKFYDVTGTPAGSPSAPNNAAILAAIGSGNPYIILAYIAVANGFSSISGGNITDERSFASFSTGNVVPVPAYEEFTNQGSDPSSPASGKLRVYTKSDTIYSKNSGGTVTPIGTDTTFVGSFASFIASGLTAPTSGSLATTIASGVAYYGGVKYSVATDGGHTYTASKDTYVDVNPATGTYTYNAVTNGASAPGLTASSLRIAKVVSGASTITAVTQAGVDSNGVSIYPAQPASLIGFATSGPQADVHTTSVSAVDITGATVTITPTRTVTVQAIVTGDFYDATGTSNDCTFNLLIDGTIVQTFSLRPPGTLMRGQFALSGQAVVAAGARVIKAQYYVSGGDTLHADQTNVSVIYA